jgi:hypothetical protein
VFFILPHDHGCRLKPNTDPAALVYAESQPTPHLNINAVYVHFQTAGFLKRPGAKTPTTSACRVLTGSERIRPVDLELTRSPQLPTDPSKLAGDRAGPSPLQTALYTTADHPDLCSSGSFEASQA